jgi:exosortase sorting signal-containing protein
VTTLSTAFHFAGVGEGAIDVDGAGNVYVVDFTTIRRCDVSHDTWSVFADTGAQTEGIRFGSDIVRVIVPIPTLSEWGVLVLVLLLLAVGSRIAKQRMKP